MSYNFGWTMVYQSKIASKQTKLVSLAGEISQREA